MTLASVEDRQTGAFLKARWLDLVMVNYAVDPLRLKPYIPRGTSLDLWQGTAYVSLVAFKFLETRVLGIPIPGHRDFEEVNLRFYVVREHGDELRRGVVFVKEIVPKAAIAWVARTIYNENYVAVPMRHTGSLQSEGASELSYEWRMEDRWQRVSALTRGNPSVPDEGSEACFIAEHYWGYARQRDGSTVEYQVEHPSWKVDQLEQCSVEIDASVVYGSQWDDVFQQSPNSSFVAIGSEVTVRRGRRLADTRS